MPPRSSSAEPSAEPSADVLDDSRLAALVHAARQARQRAHAPYSRFAVGAALLDEHGRIHAGCNVENAAYPQGQCAEATAIGALVMAGGRRILAAVVAGAVLRADGSMDDAPQAAVTPCGGCRQRLREFAADDCPIVAVDDHAQRGRWTLGQLLPMSFGPDHLSPPDGPHPDAR